MVAVDPALAALRTEWAQVAAMPAGSGLTMTSALYRACAYQYIGGMEIEYGPHLTAVQGLCSAAHLVTLLGYMARMVPDVPLYQVVKVTPSPSGTSSVEVSQSYANIVRARAGVNADPAYWVAASSPVGLWEELGIQAKATSEALADALAGVQPITPQASYRDLADRLLRHTPGLAARVSCPQAGCPESSMMLWSAIQHVNDNHMAWSRQDIADWLDTLDVDLTVRATPAHPARPDPGPALTSPTKAAQHPHVASAHVTISYDAGAYSCVMMTMVCGMVAGFTVPLATPPADVAGLMTEHINHHLAGCALPDPQEEP